MESKAACQKKHVCDNFGQNCQLTQVCDSKLDLPSIELDPIRPITVPSVRPIQAPGIVPIGTTSCSTEWVCGAFNKCSWQRLCR